MWEYAAGTPADYLKNWVRSYGGYREQVGRPVCRLEVPKSHVTIILGFGDRFQISAIDRKSIFRSVPVKYQAFVVGLGKHPLIVEHSGVQCCIEVALLPWAAAKLFSEASAQFVERIIELEDIWGKDVQLLIEQLSELTSWQKRFSLIDQVLSEKFAASNRTVRAEIQWAWEQLERQGGCVSIQQLARTIGWSDRHFAVCFREQIGITPKAAARQVRFSRAHQLLAASKHDNLSEIAAICGYSDQSHFIREFRSFSACSPTAYQKAHFADLLGTPSEIINVNSG